MAEGEFARVRQYLEKAINKGSIGWRARGDHELYATLADVAARQRDLEALRRYAPLAEQAATRYGHKLYQAIAHRAWGVAHRLAGEYAQSEARLEQALELFQKLDARWQIGRTCSELGELALALGDTAAARHYLTAALGLFQSLGAAPDADRTRAVLEKLPDDDDVAPVGWP